MFKPCVFLKLFRPAPINNLCFLAFSASEMPHLVFSRIVYAQTTCFLKLCRPAPIQTSCFFHYFQPLGCSGNPPLALKPRVFLCVSSPIKTVVFSHALSNYPALGSDYGSSRVPEKPRNTKPSCFLVFL